MSIRYRSERISENPPSRPSGWSPDASFGPASSRGVTRLTRRARNTHAVSPTAAPASKCGGPVASMIWPARTDPIHAPRLLPTPMSGKSRFPCSCV